MEEQIGLRAKAAGLLGVISVGAPSRVAGDRLYEPLVILLGLDAVGVEQVLRKTKTSGYISFSISKSKHYSQPVYSFFQREDVKKMQMPFRTWTFAQVLKKATYT